MTYDRDIFWLRIGAWCLVIGNLAAAVLNVLHRNWSVAMACFVWVFSMLVTLRSMKIHQGIRDQGRVIEAGLNAMRREMEQD